MNFVQFSIFLRKIFFHIKKTKIYIAYLISTYTPDSNKIHRNILKIDFNILTQALHLRY